MPLTKDQLGDLPSPFYRVAIKALIFDDQQRLLVLENDKGDIEVPGGGLEYDESIAECLKREFAEEFHGQFESCTSVEFIYQGQSRHGFKMLRLVVRATLVTLDGLSPDDDMRGIRFVTRDEFAQLNWARGEEGILEFADTIWGER